jgi:phospholipid transport system transporter-binding protein
VLVLPAELMHAQASACCRMLAQALRSEPGPVAVADASALRQFDSSALAVLLECRREALALGKGFAVSQLHPRLRGLATLYGVADLLPEAAAPA